MLSSRKFYKHFSKKEKKCTSEDNQMNEESPSLFLRQNPEGGDCHRWEDLQCARGMDLLYVDSSAKVWIE